MITVENARRSYHLWGVNMSQAGNGALDVHFLRDLEHKIIQTKLHIPKSSAPVLKRLRLMEKLSPGLGKTLTLITAPAGYGKTTLLSEWVTGLSMPVAWVSLDSGDQDRMRFWSHTLAALKRANPAFQDQRVLHFAYSDIGGDSMIAALLNELQRLPDPIVLVWDDFHYIHEKLLVKDVEYFLERLPRHVHLYMASRSTPPLNLSRLRSRGELAELDVHDMRLTLDEMTELLQSIPDLNFSDEDTTALMEQTEGWIAGVCLAVLSFQGKYCSQQPAGEEIANHRYIDDYFFEEVFSQLPARLQRFLLHTSILERMKAELCEAVTGMGESATILQMLERINLFVIPLDAKREWYRYHHLFQQFLLMRLQMEHPDQITPLHLAAGHWLEQHGYLAEAIDHYLDGASYEKALQLVEKVAPLHLVGEWTTLNGWLNRIPDELLLRKPTLILAHVAALYLSGKVEESTEKYWWVEQRLEQNNMLSPHDARSIMAGLAYLAAFRGYLERDMDTFLQYSKTYVQLLPKGDFLVGFGWGPDGYHPVWDIYLTNYGLRSAEDGLEAMWQLWSDTENVYFQAHLCLDFAKLYYERNQLSKAESFARRALETGKATRNPYLEVDSAIALTRIYLAKGWAERAEQLRATVETQYDTNDFPVLSERLACFRVEWEKWRGNLEQVQPWWWGNHLRYDDEIPLPLLDQYTLYVRLLMAQCKEAEAAELIERLLYLAREEGLRGNIIRLLIYKSLLLEQTGHQIAALDTLEEALSLVEQDQYIRTFVDEGMPLFQLLGQYLEERRSKSRRGVHLVSLDYVRRLLQLMSVQFHEATPLEGIQLVLTSSERKVLERIARGLTNQEIADEMCVSLSTVKSHINRLYRKLQVQSREEAIYWAQQHQLL